MSVLQAIPYITGGFTFLGFIAVVAFRIYNASLTRDERIFTKALEVAHPPQIPDILITYRGNITPEELQDPNQIEFRREQIRSQEKSNIQTMKYLLYGAIVLLVATIVLVLVTPPSNGSEPDPCLNILDDNQPGSLQQLFNCD